MHEWIPISPLCTFTLLERNAEPCPQLEFERKQGQKATPAITRCGGTDYGRKRNEARSTKNIKKHGIINVLVSKHKGEQLILHLI